MFCNTQKILFSSLVHLENQTSEILLLLYRLYLRIIIFSTYFLYDQIATFLEYVTTRWARVHTLSTIIADNVPLQTLIYRWRRVLETNRTFQQLYQLAI